MDGESSSSGTSAIVLQEKSGLVQRRYLDEFRRAQYSYYYKQHKIQRGESYMILMLLAEHEDLVYYLIMMLQSATQQERSLALKPPDSMYYLRKHKKLWSIMQYYSAPRGLKCLSKGSRPVTPHCE